MELIVNVGEDEVRVYDRRDVRRFRTDPVDDKLLDDLIETATHAPSVGFSQPWRFVKVQSAERRRAVWESFAKANARALDGYEDEQRATYAKLKLAGLKEARTGDPRVPAPALGPRCRQGAGPGPPL